MTNYTFQRRSTHGPLGGPFAGLINELRREMDPSQRGHNGVFQGVRGVYPPVNLYETEDGYVLTAEIPGVTPQTLDVSIEHSTVTLSGERKITVEAGNGTAIHRRERQSGTFRRGFELPSEIDMDAAKATHKNGVLTLNLPKSPIAKPRQIEVETA